MLTLFRLSQRLAGGILVAGCAWGAALAQQPAGRKASEPRVADPLQLYYPSPALIKARAAQATRQEGQSKLPLTTAGRADNSCNVITNGDFENQYLGVFPSGPLNIATPIDDTKDELPSWFTPNYTSPDYFASNATDGGQRPATSSRGPFLPITENGVNPTNNDGAVGIVYSTFLGAAPNYYPEYVAQQLSTPLEAGKAYYAEFWTRPASGFALSTSVGMYVAENSGHTTTFTGSATNYIDPPTRLTWSGRQITSPIITDRTIWTRVSGVIQAGSNDNFVCIGYNNPPAPPSPTQNIAAYYYIDDVALYRIPTAGPAVGCGQQVGEGCEFPHPQFPESPYKWTLDNDPAQTVLATTLLWTPPTSITDKKYRLTVKLPNNSIYTSTVDVACCPAVQPNVIDLDDPGEDCNSVAYFQVTNYDPALTYTVTNIFNARPYIPVNDQGVFMIKGNGGTTAGTFTLTAYSSCQNSSATTDPISVEYHCYGYGTVRSSATAYPNPVNETLQLPAGATEAVLLSSQGLEVQRASSAAQLDVKQLPNGLYNLRMRQNGKLVNQRIEIKH
ncbi:T9SS type A sorting domain-containing protein [Hymenobacter sp. 15J16-1T3B]|uniref:T9SS type A sorting domain-containing protein n=1 Tax=Hymenobacter sp. 15J16-1T3B TaxID=2886941 RepID=UPI001D100ED1|nr:T9SS type A sorting domain-containing protein [Hymenobacter sp. 15J16-1T3B]MCC3156429.1 T9SS type A sorting domain-containing protein [Hymenobacter sp. 15J16-1T3B]